MNDTFTPEGPARGQSGQARPRSGGGRLLRRTFIIALVLVSGGLITSSVVELYFRYRESVESIKALQREMAQGAAFKIQQFVQDIRKTMRASTQTQEIVTSGLTDAFRFELIKLLKIAPAITEVTALNSSGREKIKMSRIQTVLAEELGDRSKDEAFVRARSGATYFGSVYFVRQSEPYMRIGVPIERFAGDVIGVLIAEVNLKYIWDVVSQITVGRSGYVYVVSREGDLIAHPDISLVLQKRNLRELSQVKAALGGTAIVSVTPPNLAGQEVFPAYALIPELGWAVLVERPVREAYALLYASMLRSAILLLVGLGMAALASWVIGRRVVRPVGILRQGAERIGSGDLDYRLDIKTGDELQSLADEFNNMAGQLQESYVNLEQKVEDRTRELTESLEQQTTTSEILRVIASSPTDIQPVLDTVIANAVKLSGAKQGHIRRYDGEYLRVVAHYGETPEQIAVLQASAINPADGKGLSGRAFLERGAIHVLDVQQESPKPQAVLTRADGKKVNIPAPPMPRFEPVGGSVSQIRRTVLAVPLVREGTAIGTVTIWRDYVEAFNERQIDLVKTFADQAVIAIENVRLFHEIEQKSVQLEAANKHKSQFLANVSHELRTPLNAIIGFTRVVLRKTEGQIADLQKQNLQKVLISSEHLLGLINGLLDLAKIEAGRLEVFAEPFRLEDVVKVATSTVEPMLKDGRVRLVKDIAPDLPPIISDRDKLKQVILNLLSNAAKFTEQGEIKVSAWQENGSLKLVVSDTGIGMKQEALAHIFDEFRQEDMSTTRKYGGTGLGLAIVKKLINLLGGEVGVESEVGEGSKFTITLPVNPQSEGVRR